MEKELNDQKEKEKNSNEQNKNEQEKFQLQILELQQQIINKDKIIEEIKKSFWKKIKFI